MRHCLAPFALLALAACSGDAPDADTEDDTASGVGAPAAEEQAPPTPEPAGDMEGEPDTDGNRWFYKADSRTALFGPPQSEGVLAIGCGPVGMDESAITVTRYTAAEADGEQELTFTGASSSFSMSVSAEAMELGPDFVWQGTVLPPANDLRSVFAESESSISANLESGEALTVPQSEAVLRAIDACS